MSDNETRREMAEEIDRLFSSAPEERSEEEKQKAEKLKNDCIMMVGETTLFAGFNAASDRDQALIAFALNMKGEEWVKELGGYIKKLHDIFDTLHTMTDEFKRELEQLPPGFLKFMGVSYAFTAVVPGIAQLQNVWGNKRYIKRLCGDIVEDCSKTSEGETK